MVKKKAEHLLEVGDWIVHARHGIGQVLGFDTKTINKEKRVYFVIETASLKYWLPITDCEGKHLRKVSSSAKAKKALATIGEMPQMMDKDYRKRNAYIRAQLEKCSLVSMAELIRDLHARNKIKTFNEYETLTYDKLARQFIHEYVVACQVEKNTAQEHLNKALRQSMQKYTFPK